MDYSLTEEHQAIRQAARDFARQECLPGVIERDENQQFPREQLLKLADLGFMGMMVSAGIRRCRNGYRQLCAGHGRDQQD